jgi:hypothetical protein
VVPDVCADSASPSSPSASEPEPVVGPGMGREASEPCRLWTSARVFSSAALSSRRLARALLLELVEGRDGEMGTAFDPGYGSLA